MIKLNKCRTLYAFTEAALAEIQGQTQQTSTQDQENASSEQSQTNQTDNSKENKKESRKQDSSAAKEQSTSQAQTSKKQKSQNKTEAQTKESEPNKNEDSNKEKNLQETVEENQNKEEQKSDQQQQQSQYLFFNADEFLITTYQYENGWWYGYRDTGEAEADRKMGFFPSNYVQVIEDYSQQNLAEQQEIENMKANADMTQAFTWDDYAKISYMDDTKILVEERMKKLNDVTAPENRNPDGILGYKKIKIHESRSHAVNPWKGGVVQTSQVAIKDQSQVGKAYRQMNHYFDYDAWIEERNRNPVQKAKADPSKKKEKKKVLNW